MSAGVIPAVNARLADLLAEARARTLLLVSAVSEHDLRRQHDPLMSPILWDLGHIAHFEELWLTRQLSGAIEFGEMPGLYNPFEHPRAERADLPLPGFEGTLQAMRAIRARVLELLERADLGAEHPLLRGGYVYQMVLQHEYQHDETILQTLQLKCGAPYTPPLRVPAPKGPRPAAPGTMVRFPGGEVTIGTDDRTVAYDNERPAHRVTLAPFSIEVTPVTNGEYAVFMNAGGYRRPELWGEAGRQWLEASGAEAPLYWERSGRDGWRTRSMDLTEAVDPDRPVCHVSWHEADAYARWAGKRLPTEQEWEAAASWDPDTGEKRRFPWGDAPAAPGRANLDQLAFGTAPVGAYPDNLSPIGCYGMIGDVWEWTASSFLPWPGFEPFPYPEYSAVFFAAEHRDAFRVLRGGSWATRPGAVRNTFRNWDYPQRRQIFSGFRCASDD